MNETKANLASTLTTCPKCHNKDILVRSDEENTCKVECMGCDYEYKIFFDCEGMIEDVVPTGEYPLGSIEPCEEFGAKVVET